MNLEHCNPETVEDAIAALVAQQVDCVLLDLRLEQLNGFDILEAMRRDERTAALPVVIITADYLPDVTPRAAAYDVAMVRKPFDVRDVFDLVKELIGAEDDFAAEPAPAPLAHDAVPAPEARTLSITDLQVLLDNALDGSHHGVGLAVVRLRAVDGRPPARTTVEAAAQALGRSLEEGEVLGCSDDDEVAVLYRDVDTHQAVAELEAAITHVVGCSGHAGLAMWPEQASTADELYMAADAAAADVADTDGTVGLAR